MNKFSLNSGSLNPNNDSIRMKVAMDPGSSSIILIRNISGSGFINYLTETDYVYELSRRSYKEGEIRSVSSDFYENMGYPSGISLVPGSNICANASSKELEENYRLPVGTYIHTGSSLGYVAITGELLDDESNINDVAISGFSSANAIQVGEFFESGWNVSGGLKVGRLYSDNDTLPFVDVENMDTSSGQVARIDIHSSELNGCFFEIDLENDITQTGIALDDFDSRVTGDTSEINKKPEEILPFHMASESESRLIDEWNSIFSINSKCNIEAEFSNGKNRDQVFIDTIKKFIDKNWDEAMKKFLWGDAIDNREVRSLLTRKNPQNLKAAIFYQLYYYGASDDIKILADYNRQKDRLGKSMEWHIGIGGISKLSGKSRKIKKEYTYLSTSRDYRKIYKVYDMPPRASFAAISKSDEKMFDSMGDEFEQDPEIISGFYPLYSSRSYANTKGGGFSAKFTFNKKDYYMPSGLVSGKTYFHGDYDPKILLSYLNEIDYNDLISQESQEIYKYEDTIEEEETGQYIEEQEEEDQVQASGLSLFNADTGAYAALMEGYDPAMIQEFANESFFIDFFSQTGV